MTYRQSRSTARRFYLAGLVLVAVPALAQAQLTVLKAPLTATTPMVTDPVKPLYRFDYCPGTTGAPPNAKPIPLEWEIRFDNNGTAQLTGLSYIDDVTDGLDGTRFSLVCPATKVPIGASVICDDVNNLIQVTNISVPPCGHTTLRFQTIVDGDPPNTNLCDGADVTGPAISMRTRSPFGAFQDPLSGPTNQDTCIFINGACGLFIAKPLNVRLYHTAVDVNGPPLLPGDRVHWSTSFDLTYFTDFPPPTFSLYDENNNNKVLAPVPVGIDPVSPDPFTSKPLLNATYDYNAAARTIQIRQDPAKPPVLLSTGRINPFVEWDSTVNCAAAAGLALCNEGWFERSPGSGFLSDDPTTYDVVDGTCVTPVQPSFGTSVKRITDTDNGTAERGEELTFYVDVANSTPCHARLMDCECQATQVTVVDTFDPRFLDPASIQVLDGGVRSGNQITWIIPTLNAQGRANNPTSVRFKARVLASANDGDRVCNTGATITSAELKNVADGGLSACPTAVPASAPQVCITVSVPPVPILSVAKIADRNPAVYCPGDKVTYSITVTNGGGANATNVDVWDDLDPIWPNANINPLNGGILCTACTPRKIDWPRIATLGPGASQTVQFEATVPAGVGIGSTIRNTAHANAGNPVGIKDSTPVDITIDGAKLTFDKSLPSPLPVYSEGSTIEWTLTLRNTGGCAASNVQVTDPMNSALDPATIVCQGGSYVAPNCNWTFPTLGPAQSQVFKASGKILPGTAGQPLGNTATVTWTGGGPLASTPDPATPPIVTTSGSCTSAPSGIGNTLKVAKAGATRSDAALSWVSQATARDGYNVYHVDVKTDIANLKKSRVPPAVPVPTCNPTTATSCTASNAVPAAAGPRLFYQTRTLCGLLEDLP